jgi:hypothetical protein
LTRWSGGISHPLEFIEQIIFHLKGARSTIPAPALLAKLVDMLDVVPMEERDTMGTLNAARRVTSSDGWWRWPSRGPIM